MGDPPRNRRSGGRPSYGKRGGGPSHRPRGDVGKGIKSGMTVEDLKRLTQQRMMDEAAKKVQPITPTMRASQSHGTNLNSPLNPRAKPVAPPSSMASSSPIQQPQFTPQPGMTVQELKQLTNMRLAAAHQPEVNSMVTNAVLSNVAKSHFRDTLDGPSAVSERTATQRAAEASAKNKGSIRINQTDSLSLSPDILSPKGAQLHKVSGMYRDGSMSGDEKARAKDMIIQESIQSLRNIGSFDVPPSPSLIEPAASGWSTFQDTEEKSLFSNTPATFYHSVEYERANNEQNKVVEPPPGLSRRPSMTVPWQVAESVLDTSQPSFGRKGAAVEVAEPPTSPSSSTSSKGLPAGLLLGRRGSFGNAAQFFKFRRRSKSRLDFARDVVQQHEAVGQEDIGRMPGIAEVVDSTASDNPFYVSDAYSSGAPSRMGHDGKVERANHSLELDYGGAGSSSLALSPSTLPMMSPNGAKLRQVAELARRGSVSSQDKMRLKDEIISNSLAGGMNNMALIGKLKLKMSDKLSRARKSLEGQSFSSSSCSTDGLPPKSSPTKPAASASPAGKVMSPPPGLHSTSSSPPKIKSGIVRSNSMSRATVPPASSSPNYAGLEDRLAEAAKRVAACVASSNMDGFAEAMAELDRLKVEAKMMIQSRDI